MVLFLVLKIDYNDPTVVAAPGCCAVLLLLLPKKSSRPHSLFTSSSGVLQTGEKAAQIESALAPLPVRPRAMEDTVLQPAGIGGFEPPRHRSTQPPQPVPNPRQAISGYAAAGPLRGPGGGDGGGYSGAFPHPHAWPPSTPPPTANLHRVFISDDAGSLPTRPAQKPLAAAAGQRSAPGLQQQPPLPQKIAEQKEVPLHQQQAQRAQQRRRQKEREAVLAMARGQAEVGLRTPRGEGFDAENLSRLSSPGPGGGAGAGATEGAGGAFGAVAVAAHPHVFAKHPRPSTSSPSGTGHRLHPAELPQAGSSSRKLNPPWRTGERVSNSLLERTHVEFSTKVLRDDDPVSGISGIGRRCVARLGEDCACCVCACCVRVVCVRVCVCVCVCECVWECVSVWCGAFCLSFFRVLLPLFGSGFASSPSLL